MIIWRRPQLLHWLLLMLLSLHLGPQGAVACVRADGERSYGHACLCEECQAPGHESSCAHGCGSCGAAEGGSDIAASSGKVLECLSSAVAVPPSGGHDHESCCVDHSLGYQAASSADLPQRVDLVETAELFAAELFCSAEPLPLVLKVSQRDKAPPGSSGLTLLHGVILRI